MQQQQIWTMVLHSWIVLVWGSNSVGGHDGSTVSRMLAEKIQNHCVEKDHCEKPEVIYISIPCILFACLHDLHHLQVYFTVYGPSTPG